MVSARQAFYRRPSRNFVENDKGSWFQTSTAFAISSTVQLVEIGSASGPGVCVTLLTFQNGVIIPFGLQNYE